MSQPSTITAGLDLGDKYSYLCLLDTESGEVIEEARLHTTPKAPQRRFSGCEPMRSATETGTHSPWVSRLLERLGHQVLVANTRKLKLIYAEERKNVRLDAENLARLARLDPKLPAPLKHRGEASQGHPAIVRSCEALIEARAKLINDVRGGQVVWVSPAQVLFADLPQQEGGCVHAGAFDAGPRARARGHRLHDGSHPRVRP